MKLNRLFVRLALALVLASVGFAIGRYTGLAERAVPDIEIPLTHSVTACLDKRGAEALKANNVETARSYLNLCTDEVSKHLELNDFQIRRLKFFGQYYAERVTLWMVVFVTVAGVALSAVQLLTSFKIATRATDAGGQHEITIETGKIVIKSSAIGLMVLFTSLAFFLVFVINVYKIEEIKQETKATPLTTASSGQVAPSFAPIGRLVPFNAPASVPAAKAEQNLAPSP